MDKEDTSFVQNIAFLPIQYKISFFSPSQDPVYGMKTYIKGVTKYRNVIHKYLNKILHDVIENGHHEPFKNSRCIA